jgi:hypothetical protein
MVDSGHINKIMVRVVTPTLREIGFTRFRGREAWRYLDDPIWVFELKAVGPYFSTVTGFPPASLTARMSIFYLDFPDTPPCEVDKDGRLIPKESRCHVKYGLDNIQDQTPLRSTQMTPLERSRKDIWWIEPDGGNVETVLEDIKKSILEYALPLLHKPYNERAVQLKRRELSKK